jgi:hypothetical protein
MILFFLIFILFYFYFIFFFDPMSTKLLLIAKIDKHNFNKNFHIVVRSN